MRERVRVTVPATTANLGPGFDCLAIALQIYSTFTVELSDRPQTVVTGEGAEAIQSASDNLVLRAMRLVFERVGRPLPALSLTIDNRIPVARGLGSSAAAAVAGLVAANALLGDALDQDQIAMLACQLEGHPDNVGAAIFGGCVVTVVEGQGLLWTKVPMPEDLRAILLIPEFAMPTSEARSVLPAQVGRDVAIY
ncbi:MAG: homoserine kinase, partial [Chloroflexota bacterium]